jgi:glycosyltransferase involved in cell wall biosynthesis
MAHGLPVITTHGAPWKLLESERCGWWVPVSVDGIATALDDAMRRSPEELAAMGARGRKVVEERFAWEGIARQMIECYEWVQGEGEVPDCVRQF